MTKVSRAFVSHRAARDESVEAKKAEATERARLEVIARAEADRRAAKIDERVRIAAAVASAANIPVAHLPPKHRFLAA